LWFLHVSLITKCNVFPCAVRNTHLTTVTLFGVGRDSSVGIATTLPAGRSGDRIPVGGEIFSTRLDRPWGPPSLLYNGYRVSFPVVKRPGRVVDHQPPSSARVKERVELYLYSPSGPSWSVLGRPLPLPLPYLVPSQQISRLVT
jgi:hypothetical protein